jgi:RNA polymerase sigma-70 factor (ECF subfamily)
VSANSDDDALMARTAQGEEAAFRLLVQRWEHQVMAFLVHMLGSPEEAEDLVQDTFVKVFGMAGRYRPEGKFKSWLFRIAGNLARSRLRRRKILRWVRFDQAAHDVSDAGPGPAEQLQADRTAQMIREAVAALPDRQREALVLHRYRGLKYREIAAAMDTTVPGVESLIQRALAGLREQLAGKVELP